MPNLDHWSFQQLLWLVPALFALHNLEEAPQMEKWSGRVSPRWLPTVSTAQFASAVGVLTLAVSILTFFAVQSHIQGPAVILLLGTQATIAVNALPHMGASLWFRRPSPGVFTAVLLNIPFSVYLFSRALAEQVISSKTLLIALLIAPVAMVLFTVVSLKLGAVMASIWQPRHKRLPHP